MPQVKETVTLRLFIGKDLPAWDHASCAARWGGLTVPNGARGMVVGRAEWLDDPEFDSEWWIVHFPEYGFAPCEAHDHLGFE